MLTKDTESKSERLLHYFFIHPTTEVHLRSLARQLHMSPTGIQKAVAKIIKKGIVIVKKDSEKHLLLFKANNEDPSYKALKRTFNQYQLYTSGLLNYLIESYGKPETIILFGSFAKGEDREESDIDIAIITSKKLRINLSEFEKKLSRKISIITLPKGKIEKEFLNTLANGIVLYGYLTVT